MNTVVKSLLTWAVLTAAPALAQYQPVAGEGPSATSAFTAQMLKTLEAAVSRTPQLRAVRDALANNSVQSLAIHPDVENRTDALCMRDGKPVKWKVENSWGQKSGNKGWFTIDRKWFDRHVFQVIIDRRFVPDGLLAVTKQKTILLPPWDPFTDW